MKNAIKYTDYSLFFKSIEETNCMSLCDFISDAKIEGLSEITLVEAIPDNDNPDYKWCTYNGEVTDRSDCKKHICLYYESKSGRGKCKHQGTLYRHGEEITFNVSDSTIKL